MNQTFHKKYNLGSLFLFAIPNVIMMITLSLYIIIDGMFISRILGTTALSAANMVYPVICFEMALAIMIATGASAIIARKLGEGKQQEARENLTFLILVELACGIVVAAAGNLFLEQIITISGASSLQFPLCLTYAGILFAFAPAFFLQTAFQTFFVTAGKPALGLAVTLSAGISNIFLDYLFMGLFDMGIAGAAIATGIGYCIPAAAGIVFFLCNRHNPLHFVKPRADWKVLLHSCANGSSEMVTNLANAVTTFLFNYSFLQYYGEDGVAAITIVLYFQYIFTALFFGYSNGIAPIISFKYGCGDRQQLKKIFRSSLLFLLVSAVSATILVRLSIGWAVTIFTPADSAVYAITVSGFSIYSIGFLVMGPGIFASALFTAFSDGRASALISFSRTFLFVTGSILLLPLLFQETGLWAAVPAAEALGAVVAAVLLIAGRKKYSYA